MKKPQISVVEIDARDARFQSGIATYFTKLESAMPDNVSTYRIIFYRSPEIKDVRIVEVDNELQIYHPNGFPFATLFDGVFAFVAPKLSAMPNLVVKSDCLGCEGLAYMIKSRIFCKTIGVLHCQPKVMPGQPCPYFNMDHVICVADNGVKHVAAWKCKRPVSVIYNGVEKPKITTKKPKDGVFRFIFANGWGAHKGFAKIVPAIRRVAKKHKIEVYVLGGWTRENEPLFEEIADLPIVKVGLLTDAAEIAKYHEMADCALFASRAEAAPFAGIDAMAYNLPIIATTESGVQEMFDKAALYADMNENHDINIDQYTKLMLRVIEEKTLRMKLGVAAYSRYLSRYTLRQMAKKTLDVYDTVLWGTGKKGQEA